MDAAKAAGKIYMVINTANWREQTKAAAPMVEQWSEKRHVQVFKMMKLCTKNDEICISNDEFLQLLMAALFEGLDAEVRSTDFRPTFDGLSTDVGLFRRT